MTNRAPPLRKGMSLRQVRNVLGDDYFDVRRDGTLYAFERLVFDEATKFRLAIAYVWFRAGKSTRWGEEVEDVAEAWRLIKAGDPPTLWAAGLAGEPPKDVGNAMIEILLLRKATERDARAKAERAAARKAGVPVAKWRARRRR